MPPTEENNELTFIGPDGEQTINFDELPVHNNPDCEHEFVREEGEPDIPGTYTEMCIKPRCGVGRIVRL